MIKSNNKKILPLHPKNEIIVQHNHLIEARYHLTLQEKRLMCWLASQVKSTDEDFKEHGLSIKEFANLLDIQGDHLYRTLDTITHKLMQKIITIRSINSNDFEKAALLGGARYQNKKGIIKLSFHPYLKPYMLQLKESFTKVQLGDLLGLKSVHSIRIFELLKQYELIGERKVLLNDLREYNGITSNQYKKFNDLKKDVLERAKIEINAKTDLLIDYEEIKESRKVVAINFTIQKNPHFGKTEFEKNQNAKITVLTKEYRSKLALIESLVEYGFGKTVAKRLIKNSGETVVADALKAVNIQIERGNVKNPKAMLQTAIKEQWHPEKFKQK